MITPAHWDKAVTYLAYRQMVEALVAEGKTTGENQSEDLWQYTKLNVQRMNRWDKTAVLDTNLQATLQKVPPQKWLILTEGWCGDAAQNIPILAKIAEAAPQIELKFLLRDENLDIMDSYLTNGGRSIPKLIAFQKPTHHSNEWVELFNWGPRPIPAQNLVMELKNMKTPFQELAEKLHKWYAEDKNEHIQAELKALLLPLI